MERRRLAGMASRLQPIFCPRKILKTQKFCRVVASMNELACRICGLVCCFRRLLGVLGVLAVGSSLLNRQDAKDAKVGFTELSRLCGYKALS
jgi:hypothetical protein